MSPDARDVEIRRLRRGRPRSRFLRASIAVLGALAVASFASGTFRLGDLFTARRAQNLDRFVDELVPHALRGAPDVGPGDWLGFYTGLFVDEGAVALWVTTCMSIAAAVLAAAIGALAAPLVARTLASPEPWLPGPRDVPRAVALAFSAWITLARLALVFLRAIPEYVWAFLLVAAFGLGAWPAILALAIHNAGILGRLGGEVFENLDPGTPRALRAAGASRLQILAAALVPASMPRLLAFFFYRWETCIREATVLGMLGVVSLGYSIQHARAGLRYDEMVFYVALGAVVVQLGDLVSSWARRVVRDAGGGAPRRACAEVQPW